jgi:hypothetical protein
MAEERDVEDILAELLADDDDADALVGAADAYIECIICIGAGRCAEAVFA